MLKIRLMHVCACSMFESRRKRLVSGKMCRVRKQVEGHGERMSVSKLVKRNMNTNISMVNKESAKSL